MINRRPNHRDHTTTVTFSLDDRRTVSVVGDFNGWNPRANPLHRRTNGLRSSAVTVPTGTELHFRYVADSGEYFDDPDADGFEDNGFGGANGIVRTAG